MVVPELCTRNEEGTELPVLVWRWKRALRTISTAPLGGGLGSSSWVLNAEVPDRYSRPDPDVHLSDLSQALGLAGRGVGMLTSASVRGRRSCECEGVAVTATVGLTHPIKASAEESTACASAGTINVVALVPQRLSDAALVNCVITATEAKAQALYEAGFEATGTPTDALCVACPDDGPGASFGGPRSEWGARLARAVHRVVLHGAEAELTRTTPGSRNETP